MRHAAPTCRPSNCHGKTVDHRQPTSTRWASCSISFHSGRLPFSGETFAEILAKQIVDTPEPPSKHAQIPAELDKLIMKCLAKDPAGRPQTAKELGVLLSSILVGAAARVQKAAGQPTSATTLSASAIEVKAASATWTEVAQRKGGKGLIIAGVGVAAVAAIVAIALARSGHAPRGAAARRRRPRAAHGATARGAAAVAPAAGPPRPSSPRRPRRRRSPTTRPARSITRAPSPGGATSRPDAHPARPISAPDTGLVTHNPFE